jgi:uncharacterized membrane protein YwzB
MSLLRSLAVFILSFTFITAVLFALTSYDLDKVVQKDAIKGFIRIQGLKHVDDQCQEECSQNPYESCLSDCKIQKTNQIQTGVDKAVDELYDKKIFGVTLEELSSFLSYYLLFAAIGIFSGILLFFASENPFSTIGKDFITIAVSFFISSLTPDFVTASVNLPFDLGRAISDYLSPAFSQQMNYAIVFFVAGIIFIVVDYLLAKRKAKIGKKKL